MTKIVFIETNPVLSWKPYVDEMLVLGEIYDGEEIYIGMQLGYNINVNLLGVNTMWFPAEFFITLAEWRDKQINDILND